MSTVEMAQAARAEGFYVNEPHEDREEIEIPEQFDEITGPMGWESVGTDHD